MNKFWIILLSFCVFTIICRAEDIENELEPGISTYKKQKSENITKCEWNSGIDTQKVTNNYVSIKMQNYVFI